MLTHGISLAITEAASGSDPDTGLRAVAALRDLTERLEILQVDNARRLGWSWQQIAARLGVTKQTVHRKHGKRTGGSHDQDLHRGRQRHRGAGLRARHPARAPLPRRRAPPARPGRRRQPAGAVPREHGVTPGRVEAEIVRLSGGGLFGDLDRGALAAVGVDIDAVRATTEASFGQEALTRAARAVHPKPAGSTRGRPPSPDVTAPSSPSAPAPGRPSRAPAARRRPGAPPRPSASRISPSASSPSARG